MKKLLSLIISLIIAFSVFVLPANAYKPTIELHCGAVILYNTDTDTVLFSQNEEEKLYPASLTKIMVAILFVEKESNLKDLTLTVSSQVAETYRYSDAVTAGFEAGETVNGYDLLAYTMVKSCADAAAVIAEHIAGSEAAFVDMMNEKAQQIGMYNTHFSNCHGLHENDHYSTARDLCILTEYALKYSVISDVASLARYETQNGITLAATNMLIDPSTDYYYQYATGFKTGFTDEAGRCLASVATKDGMTYICVMLKCPAVENSIIDRYEFIDSAKLFDWAFDNFQYRSVLNKNETVDSVPIEYSWDYDTVNIRPEKDIYALVPSDADESTFMIKTVCKQKTLEAPLKQGTSVGTVAVYYAGECIGTANAVTAETVEGSKILKATEGVKDFLQAYKNIFIAALLVLFIVVIIFIALTVRLNSKKKKYGKVKRYKRF